ncbi:hypothetical protein ACWIGG_15690 [Micromonospora aurantiaca (nom. illeg.)]
MKVKIAATAAAAALAATGLMGVTTESASADPGHCWVSGAIADANPYTLYQIRNKCGSSIRVRIVWQYETTGATRKGSCKTIPAYGDAWWSDTWAFRYFWAENC